MELGKAYVQVVPSAQGISGSISNVLKGESASAGTTAGTTIASKIKGVLLKAGVGIAVTKGLKASLEAGGALQQSLGGLETIYGDAADAAKNYAKEAYKAGISQNSYAEQAVSFGAALKQAYEGDTAKAVKAANTAILDMTDNAAKMGTPLENIQNAYQGFAKQNYTMLDNLKLGYGGTKSEMERLLADASKLSGQEYDISNLGDVYDAIHVIQQDLGLTGVAAKEASETFSGSFQAMKAAGENVLASLSLGQDVGPMMSSFVQTVVTFIGGNLIPMVVNIVKSLPAAVVTAIQTGGPLLLSAGKSLLESIKTGITTGLPQLLESVQTFLPNLLAMISSNLPIILNAGRNLIVGLGRGIFAAIPQIITTVAQLIPQIVNFLTTNIPVIAQKGADMIRGLAGAFIANLPSILVAIGRLGLSIVTGIIRLIPTVISAALSLVGGIVSALGGGAISLVKTAASNLMSALLVPIRAVVSKVVAVVREIKNHLSFSGFASTVRGAFNRVKEAITSPIQTARDTISGIIKKIKGMFPLSIGKIFSNLKVPHINVSGGSAPFGIGGKGSVPKISVSWNAKAMDNPYLFSGATLFGAGETSDEVLYGRAALMRDIGDAVSGRGSVTNNFYITVDGAESPEQFADRLVKRVKMEMRTV